MTTKPARWLVQNASDTYDRFQIELEGFGIVMRVECIDGDGEKYARLIATARDLEQELRNVLTELVAGSRYDRQDDIREVLAKLEG